MLAHIDPPKMPIKNKNVGGSLGAKGMTSKDVSGAARPPPLAAYSILYTALVSAVLQDSASTGVGVGVAL